MRVLILIGCLLTTMTTGRSSPVTGSYGRLPGGGNGLAGGGRAVGAHPRRLWPLWFPLQTPMEIDYNGYDDTSLNPANMVPPLSLPFPISFFIISMIDGWR